MRVIRIDLQRFASEVLNYPKIGGKVMNYAKPSVVVIGEARKLIETISSGKPVNEADSDTGATSPGPAYDLDE
jgi:hypothetical protein